MTADWPAAAEVSGLAGQLGGHPALPADRARDWVRPGIMLYGGSPFADQDAASLA
jgi:alanine racemase